MAALNDTQMTLLDIAKTSNEMGEVLPVVEILSQVQGVLQDIPWQEAENGDYTEVTVRTDLPTPDWVKYGQGTTPKKSRTAQFRETCAMMEIRSEIERKKANRNGQRAALRAQQDKAFIQGANHELARALFYSDMRVDPTQILGLSPRYSDQSAVNGRNILTSAATPDGTDNSSIWLIGWGPETVHGQYPRGTKAGIDMMDLGLYQKTDSNGAVMDVYGTVMNWHVGFVVKDWRSIVRINFDYEDVIASAASGPNLKSLMIQALHFLPENVQMTKRFYMNADVYSLLDQQSLSGDTNLAFKTLIDAQGHPIDSFRGVPIRRTDAILNTESGI